MGNACCRAAPTSSSSGARGRRWRSPSRALPRHKPASRRQTTKTPRARLSGSKTLSQARRAVCEHNALPDRHLPPMRPPVLPGNGPRDRMRVRIAENGVRNGRRCDALRSSTWQSLCSTPWSCVLCVTRHERLGFRQYQLLANFSKSQSITDHLPRISTRVESEVGGHSP